MAKIVNYQKKEVTKMTKAQIDSNVSEFLRLDEEIKAKTKRLKEIKEELNEQFVKPNSEKEALGGNTHQWEKVPKNDGANSYTFALLKALLTPMKLFTKICTPLPVQYDVNTKTLAQLVKEGTLKKEQLDACREDKWTFTSKGKRLEKNTIAKENKEKRQAKIL